MPRTRTGAVDASPVLSSTRRISMNSAPSPYLNDTRRQSIHFGISNTSSCSTSTHSIGPIPSGKTNVSGSENGGSVKNPRSRSHTSGGVGDTPPVVPIENAGGGGQPPPTRSPPPPTPHPARPANRGAPP